MTYATDANLDVADWAHEDAPSDWPIDLRPADIADAYSRDRALPYGASERLRAYVGKLAPGIKACYAHWYAYASMTGAELPPVPPAHEWTSKQSPAAVRARVNRKRIDYRELASWDAADDVRERIATDRYNARTGNAW